MRWVRLKNYPLSLRWKYHSVLQTVALIPLQRAEWHGVSCGLACFGSALILFAFTLQPHFMKAQCAHTTLSHTNDNWWRKTKAKLEMLWVGYWVLWKLRGRKSILARAVGRWLREEALKKGRVWLAVVFLAYNPNTSEVKAGASAWSTGQSWGETILTRKQKQKKGRTLAHVSDIQ